MANNDLSGAENPAWVMEYITLVMRINNLCGRWAHGKGMPYSHMLTLFALSLRPQGCEPSELADGLAMPRQSMTYILASLDRQGYVTRSMHLSDRRRKTILATEKGLVFVRGAVDELTWALDNFLSRITPDKEHLLAMTRQYIATLEEQLADASPGGQDGPME